MPSEFFVWNADPVLVQLGPFVVRWYGLLFGLAFVLGYVMVRSMYRQEGKGQAYLDSLLLYLLGGTIIGARLGHVLFYDPGYYFSNPLEIAQVWKGGLASHGGAVGIFTALFLFARRHSDQPYLWLLDRVAVPAALGGGLIRLGNFFNSEILGKPSDVPWAIVFARVDPLPRHPVQLYEAIGYGLIFLALFAAYRQLRGRAPRGLLVGLFLAGVFALRFLLEFAKTPQAALDGDLTLTMGQLLSLPMIAVGAMLVWRSLVTGVPASLNASGHVKHSSGLPARQDAPPKRPANARNSGRRRRSQA